MTLLPDPGGPSIHSVRSEPLSHVATADIVAMRGILVLLCSSAIIYDVVGSWHDISDMRFCGFTGKYFARMTWGGRDGSSSDNSD